MFSWESKNTSMVYDWHQEIVSPQKPRVATAYKKQICQDCGRYRCFHQTMRSQRPSTAATLASLGDKYG